MSFSIYIKQHDISDCGVAEAAEKFGLRAEGFKGKLTSLYKVPKPTILHLKKLNGLLHFVVLYKITKHHLHLMDPLDGRINRVSFHDFSKEWTGYLIIVEPDNNFKKGSQGISALSRVLSIFKRDINKYIKALAGSLVYIIIALSTSVFIKYIIDDILPGRDWKMLTTLSLTMLLLIIVSFILSYYKSHILLKLSIETDRKLITDYLGHLFQLPQQFFDLRKTGELTSRVDDAFKIRSLISDIVINVTIGILTLIVSFVLLFSIFWRLALFSLMFIPVYLVIYYLYDLFNRRVQREIMETAAQFESTLIEGLKSERTVKHFGMEALTMRKITKKLSKLNDSLSIAGKRGIAMSNLGESSSRILSLLVLWVGGTYVLSSSITIGELFSFYSITGLFSSPLTALIGLNVTIREGFTAAERLFEIMDLDTENYLDGIVSPIENVHSARAENVHSLKMENISFRYPSRESLFCGLDIELKSGEITALSGDSGCGKSTIASLILRMYEPTSGTISLDGVDISHINLNLWRQWVTIVPQNLDLFSGTIIENIALGVAEADVVDLVQTDYEYIIEICRDLNLLEFIEKLPEGFHTQVGEGGSFLSRGQQQRIAIARALYRKARILILDEATSSLDNGSEELIERAVVKAREKGIMILMISHKKQNTRIADRIINL